MKLRATLLAAALLCFSGARGQDTAAPEPDVAPPATQAEKAAGAADDEPLTAPPSTTKAAGPSPDSFKPSEEISEDLSVSFPVDI
jgi:hypothetical protein